jgi:hypothetical protein
VLEENYYMNMKCVNVTGPPSVYGVCVFVCVRVWVPQDLFGEQSAHDLRVQERDDVLCVCLSLSVYVCI